MSLWSRIFGCHHRNLTVPITPVRNRPTSAALTPAALITGTYRVCIDCGKEFPFSLQSMSIVYPRRSKQREEATMRAEEVKSGPRT
jgi:hypothetical protein